MEDVLHALQQEGYAAGWDRLVEKWQRLRSRAKRAALRGLMQYVSEREGMIHYPQFRRRGWDMRSGPTESECKTTTVRVKGSGRRWRGNHAEAMMALAAFHHSRLWEQYWQTLAPQPT